MIKKALKIEKGAKTTGQETVATMSMAQAKQIATEKLADLNTKNVEAATKVVAGTARSMGVKIQ